MLRDLPQREDLPPGMEPPRPISVTSIPATVFDNPAVLQVNPEYYAYLLLCTLRGSGSAILCPWFQGIRPVSWLPKTSPEARMPAYFAVELETTNAGGRDGGLPPAVPATIEQYDDHYLARERRDRTDRGRAGAEAHRHPRIRPHSRVQPLVQFAGIPEKFCRAGSIARPDAPSSWRAQANQAHSNTARRAKR